MAGLQDFLQGASNSVASNVSAPVDGLAWLLRKAGVSIPSNPVGGSDWMAQQGFTREPESRNMGLLGDAVGGVAPMLMAAKAPQIARGLLQMGENAAAPRVLRKESGMFIGPSAKTWDAEAANKAQQLAAKGADPRAIWSDTGTWKGPDGKWRQEIPDNMAKARDYQLTPAKAFQQARFNAAIDDSQPLRERAESMLPYWQKSKGQLQEEFSTTGGRIVDAALSGDKTRAMQLQRDRSGLTSILEEMGNLKYGPASSYLKHGELGKAYPDVYKMHTRIDPDELGSSLGQYMRESPLQGEQVVLRGKPVFSDGKSTQIHELQHAIQQREGWAMGGSPEMFANTMPYESLVKRSNSQQDAFIRAKAAGGVDPESGLSLGGLKQSIDDLSGQIQSWKSPHDQYMHLAGEAEARATQARIPLDAAQRRALFPEDSYDVPIGQLIMRGVGR